jgi:enediyne biosynthesis protein E4
MIRFLTLLTIYFLLSCNGGSVSSLSKRFIKLSPEQSGINFSNDLVFDSEFNIYTYRNFYNGGGVGIGDLNNDGLVDIYFTANMKPNQLYLNKGNFKFEEITRQAGVEGKRSWSTGVSIADVNGDGWLDIYVCNSGDIKGDNKENELFINNRDLTFTDRAKEYGLNDRGFTTHAAFFDYDKDGDLDLYILNNSYQAIGSFNLKKNERPKRDSLGGDKFLRNDSGHFVDVSEQVGVYGSVIGFGLGVTVGDVDRDGWQDIYVSNDFFERDYLYLNQRNGTFKESLTEQIKSISGASMGADMADINNDEYPDIFVTEMLPFKHDRLKTVTTFEDWNRFQYNLSNDYYYQFTRNMLQLNNADGTFSEVGRLAGVEATDWSWGALIFDMDNDGVKDIFIATGIYKDLTNQDFLQFAGSEEFVKSVVTKKGLDYKKLVDIIPSNSVPNFAYHNDGNFKFEDKAQEWGLSGGNFSNGAAYGDLDNDGDLDLVVNCVNSNALVYQNTSRQIDPNTHYLKFILNGSGKNTNAIGARITAIVDKQKYYLEQMPMRGFQSTMDERPNLSVGSNKVIPKIIIQWPNEMITELDSVTVDQTLSLTEPEVILKDSIISTGRIQTIFRSIERKDIESYTHVENQHSDFDRDRLVYHMLSTTGPCLCKGDLNSDGLDDFFIGGAKGQPGALFIQSKSGKFVKFNSFFDGMDIASEDVACGFFDADGDKDLDLYVGSGGSEFTSSSIEYADRLYFNDGTGKFIRSSQLLPTLRFENTSVVEPSDYDSDGDVDLFVGIRAKSFSYGVPVNGYILSNNGKGIFQDVTEGIAPSLSNIGMVTDASWADIDGDSDQDLLVVGEWMEIKVFINVNGKLREQTMKWGLEKSNGWWNKIVCNDFDNDGDIDFVVGNHGKNSRFQASSERPVSMWISDFDQNGSIEQITSIYFEDKQYPLVLKHDLVSQIPSLRKKYLKYEDYKDQKIQDFFLPNQLKRAIRLDTYNLATSILINDNGRFILKELPPEAQFSPIYAIQIDDFNHDGNKDILLGGNLYATKPEVGRYDASYGLLLQGNGKGEFKSIPGSISGLCIQGEVRDFTILNSGNDRLLLVARNNDTIKAIKLN